MKKRIALFFGGMGNEAEVSIISVQNVAANFDFDKHALILVYWDKDGKFYLAKNFSGPGRKNKNISEADFKKTFDVALLMTHGRFGEDGVLQGILEKAKVKYCGCGVLSSALCMDKAVCKTYLSGHGIPQAKFAVLDLDKIDEQEKEKTIKNINRNFKYPLFVKPSNSGSSVGISKVDNKRQLAAAMKKAGYYDQKVVVEQGLAGTREIEVGILGNGKLTVSRPGELVLDKEFYDYDDKYKKNKTIIKIPADISVEKARKIKKIAEQVYRLCDCRGFARIDFFLHKGKIYLNEINTLPGFTQFSMYPMLMMDKGISYRDLINKIIALA